MITLKVLNGIDFFEFRKMNKNSEKSQHPLC